MENFIVLVIILLIISNVVFYISNLVKLSPILGLIFIGVISSTNYFKKMINPNKRGIEYLGDLGLIVLMFVLGYESSLQKLKKNKKDTIIISLITFIFPFILGFGLFFILGYDILTSFIVGLVLSITAEVINGKILMELEVLDTDIGSSIVGIGLIDSLIGIIILTLIMFFYGKIKKDLFVSILLIISFIIGIKYKTIVEKDNKILEYNNKQVKNLSNLALKTIGPFFFINMGYNLDLTHLFVNPILILLLLVIAIFGKVGGSLLSKPFVDFSLKQLKLIGWGINSRGAVDLTVVLLAFRNGLLDKKTYSALVITIIITILCIIYSRYLMITNKKELNKNNNLIVINKKLK